MPAFSFCGARCAAWGPNPVPRASRRFWGVPPPRCLISVSFFAHREFVRELGEISHRDTECSGDVAHRGPGGVAVAAFDHRERRDRDPGSLGDGLLRLAFLLTDPANRLPERWLWSR